MVDEVSGLAEALHLAPVRVSVTAALTDGTDVDATLHLRDARAALILKAHAYRGRWSHRDALDIWRRLEAASHAGHRRRDGSNRWRVAPFEADVPGRRAPGQRHPDRRKPARLQGERIDS